MTMEQANEKAKKLERSSEASRLRHHCRAWLKGTSGQCRCDRHRDHSVRQQTCGDGTSGAKLLAPRPLFTAAREVKTIVRSVQLRR